MTQSSALRRGTRRRQEQRLPPNPSPHTESELLAANIAYTRTALLWLLLVAAAALFVSADQLNKSSALFNYIWGEAFRAVLLGTDPSPNGGVTFIQSPRAGSSQEYKYFARVTGDGTAMRKPIAETLAHWLAADAPTMVASDARSFKIDRISFDVSVPALRDTLNITIQKRGVNDLYQYGDSAALNFLTFSPLYKETRSTWPSYARKAFFDRCAGKESELMGGFITEPSLFSRGETTSHPRRCADL